MVRGVCTYPLCSMAGLRNFYIIFSVLVMFSCFPHKHQSRLPSECIFCSIGEHSATRIVYQDEDVIAFHDIKPAANTHLLVVPTRHIGTVKSLRKEDYELVQKMKVVGQRLLREQGYSEDNIRLGFHIPPFNSIDHLHLHCLGLPFRNWWIGGKYSRNTPLWFNSIDTILEKLK
ncbi:hypothetical protein K7432_002800 [Basidiobolus ranarum]|uniref:HIT domain-containing protein n=1 Tax=Basidiobolus ranarum TaxID=34480 RepID=A0ABR2W832_9FUNG